MLDEYLGQRNNRTWSIKFLKVASKKFFVKRVSNFAWKSQSKQSTRNGVKESDRQADELAPGRAMDWPEAGERAVCNWRTHWQPYGKVHWVALPATFWATHWPKCVAKEFQSPHLNSSTVYAYNIKYTDTYMCMWAHFCGSFGMPINALLEAAYLIWLQSWIQCLFYTLLIAHKRQTVSLFHLLNISSCRMP